MRVILIVLSVLFTTSVNAEILFQDNFDSHPDWKPTQSSARECSSQKPLDCTPVQPSGYSDYRIMGVEQCSNTDGYHDTMQIIDPKSNPFINTSGQGGSGKSFVYWNEPCLTSAGSWGSDGLLGISIPDSNELFVRYWIKYQPDWKWTRVASPMIKLLHLSHFDPVYGNIYNFSGGLQNKPRIGPGFAKYGGGKYRVEQYFQVSPLTAKRDNSGSFVKNATLGPSPVDWAVSSSKLAAPGDGNWHALEFYVKMNNIGKADGLARTWYDGNMIHDLRGISWVPVSDDPARWRWNHVWLGGNNYNIGFIPAAEQWHLIDDFVVYTPMSPDNPECNNQCTSDGRLPLSYVINRRSVSSQAHRVER